MFSVRPIACAALICVMTAHPSIAQTAAREMQGAEDEITAAESWLYGNDSDFVYRISPDTGEVIVLGTIENRVLEMTDSAITPDGRIYAITNNNLYLLDAAGVVRRVGDLNLLSSANALASDANGRLFGATSNGTLFEADRATGRARIIGTFGNSLFSGGDIAFAPDGSLFGVSASANLLLRIDVNTGRAVSVGPIGVAVEGIAFGLDGRLYGAAAGARLVVINPATGAAAQVALFGGFRSMTGLAAVPPPVPPPGPPVLTAAVSGSTINLNWTATAGATSYVLEAGSATGLSNVFLGDVGTATALSASAPNGSYFIRVRPRNGQVLGQASNEVLASVGCAAVPSSPSNLTAQVAGGLLTISWNGSPGSVSYLLQAGTAPSLANAFNGNVGGVNTLQLSVAGVPRGTYYLRVLGLSSCGTSAPSAEFVLTLQ